MIGKKDFMGSDTNGFEWATLERPEQIEHEFEIDLNCVVITNHKLTIEGIERSEGEALDDIYKGSGIESEGTVDSIACHAQNFFDDLRRAARLLALVGLVTRLQHWISRFAKQRRHKAGTVRSSKLKRAKARKSILVRQLEDLNEALGAGPVPVTFFEKIATLRDSVIHGDSQMEWKDNGTIRAVADEFRSVLGADLSEEQLQDAIQKAIQQVKWYDARMQEKSSVQHG
jgi:hypothetical protein